MDQHLQIILLFIVTSYSCAEIPIVSDGLGNLLNDGQDFLQGGLPDAHRNPCQLIESRNFICDEHFVTTEDGYILSIQHIINPVLIANNKTTIKTVVVTHGLLGSATNWLINSEGGFAADWTGEVISANLEIEGRNAPYLLSNLGYDVWLPNLRGCRYSRNHTYLNPLIDYIYWKFSYDHMITYDAPNIIDYILKKINQAKLAWIGHSVGNLILFGLLSEQPEYSAKIKPFIALAPTAHLGHVKTPFRVLADIPTLKTLATVKGGEFNIPKSVLDLLADRICVLPLVNEVCASVFYLFGGYDPAQFNLTRISVYITGGFCGSSIWSLVHLGYNMVKDQFAKFDYGLLGDLIEYDSFNPPQYNLSAINLENIILISAKNDLLANPTDIKTLTDSLKVQYTEHIVSYPKFSHLDFLWAKNVYSQVYEPMVRYLRTFA